MLLPVLLVALSCASLIYLVFCKPTVQVHGLSYNIYWLAPAVGAALLLVTGCIGWRETLSAVTADSEINPIKILLLFLSMTLLSIFLDTAGFFRNLAGRVLQLAKSSQKALFFYLYFTVSVLTVFTSNDIIVLTFTPFICYFAFSTHIDPIPYLFCEFIAANTWSMLLMIGNPTNIYLATAAGVSFMEYTAVMLLPTLFAGAASLVMLWLIFRRRLCAPIAPHNDAPEPFRDRLCVLLGLGHLGVCILALVFSSALGLPMWCISLGCCVSLFVLAAVGLKVRRRNYSILTESLKRAPWEIIPFILSMFVLVFALERCGAVQLLAAMLARGNTLVCYGVSSFFAANIINNIPMSVLYASLVGSVPAGAARTAALYGAVIGSNLGAFFTPLGALAGIMWTGMLKAHGVPLSFTRFVRYGALTALPALCAALGGLALALHSAGI